MIEELAKSFIQKYPDPLVSDELMALGGYWVRLRFASEVARQAGQRLDYQLCYHFSTLFWAMGNRNPELASKALKGIFDSLDPEEEHKDLFGFCYLLASLERGRALSGDGKIYFYEEARDMIQESPCYESLLQPLLKLQGKAPGDPLILKVIREIEDTDGPRFEKNIVKLLLRELKRPAGQ